MRKFFNSCDSFSRFLTKFLFLICLFLLNSCDTFHKPVKEYLEKYTTEVYFGGFDLGDVYPIDNQEYYCLPSDSDFTVKILLANPYNYTLISTFQDINDSGPDLDGCKLTQD